MWPIANFKALHAANNPRDISQPENLIGKAEAKPRAKTHLGLRLFDV